MITSNKINHEGYDYSSPFVAEKIGKILPLIAEHLAPHLPPLTTTELAVVLDAFQDMPDFFYDLAELPGLLAYYILAGLSAVVPDDEIHHDNGLPLYPERYPAGRMSQRLRAMQPVQALALIFAMQRYTSIQSIAQKEKTEGGLNLKEFYNLTS